MTLSRHVRWAWLKRIASVLHDEDSESWSEQATSQSSRQDESDGLRGFVSCCEIHDDESNTDVLSAKIAQQVEINKVFTLQIVVSDHNPYLYKTSERSLNAT